MEVLVKILVAGGTLGLMDLVWLRFANKLYRDDMASMMLDEPNILPAVLFYVMYVTAILIFVVNPALAKDSVWQAVVYGAFLGVVAYGTYGLTNLAVFKGFTPKLIVMDMAWGAILTATAATITYLVVKYLFS